MSNRKINNRVLNNYYDHYKAQNATWYLEAKDSSQNKIGEGDYILYCPGTKYNDSYITKILLETIDGSSEQVLCIRMKNGQYRTISHLHCYLANPDFIALHKKRVYTP